MLEKTMVAKGRRNWRDLCIAALNAKDSDELLRIVQDLTKALKGEEQILRDFREAMRVRAMESSREVRI
jgi:hypothetical protein